MTVYTGCSRHLFQFHLYSSEAWLMEQIALAKAKLKFRGVIVDALLLFFDLSQGRTEQLNRLFPFVLQAAPVPGGERPLSRPNTPPKEITLDIKTGVAGGNGKQAMENFLSGMARLQGLDPTVYLSKSVTSTPKAIKKITGSEIALEVPTFDELDLDLI